jgi:hypothetical protein
MHNYPNATVTNFILENFYPELGTKEQHLEGFQFTDMLCFKPSTIPNEQI